MADGQWNDPRPMSPHLQVWRWHWTLAASIAHRVTGIALYFGAFLITAWIVALAADGNAWLFMDDVVKSIFGQVVLFLWAAAVLQHMFSGIKHLLWDGPHIGFDPAVAERVAVMNFTFSVVGAAALFAAVYFFDFI